MVASHAAMTCVTQRRGGARWQRRRHGAAGDQHHTAQRPRNRAVFDVTVTRLRAWRRRRAAGAATRAALWSAAAAVALVAAAHSPRGGGGGASSIRRRASRPRTHAPCGITHHRHVTRATPVASRQARMRGGTTRRTDARCLLAGARKAGCARAEGTRTGGLFAVAGPLKGRII